jgi:hypothetical protein
MGGAKPPFVFSVVHSFGGRPPDQPTVTNVMTMYTWAS